MKNQQITLPIEYAESLLSVINVLEVLTELSEKIMEDLAEGESYEVLVNRIKVLSTQIFLLSEMSSEVKIYLLPRQATDTLEGAR